MRCLSIKFTKSTKCPSNSGPSTQANFVSSPTCTRQPPHIPVPSTMIGFRLTIVLILYGLVVSATVFIIITGPITTTSAISIPLSINCCSAVVTNPFIP